MAIKTLTPEQTEILKDFLEKFNIDELPADTIKPLDSSVAERRQSRKKVWSEDEDEDMEDSEESTPRGMKKVSPDDYYTVQEIEGKVQIKIPTGIIEKIKEAVQLHNDAGKWYYNLRDSAQKALGDDDYKLFLALVASTSPQNPLKNNLNNAVQVFVAIKHDLQANEELLLYFMKTCNDLLEYWKTYKKSSAYKHEVSIEKQKQREEKKANRKPNAQPTKFKFNSTAANKVILRRWIGTQDIMKKIETLEVAQVLKNTFIKSSWNNIARMFAYFYEKKFKVSVQQVITDMKKMFTNYNEETSFAKVGNLRDSGNMISSNKVWSFYCNLLDPEDAYGKVGYQVDKIIKNPDEKKGEGLALGVLDPVTIDTWIIRFMYDNYAEGSPLHYANRNVVFSNIGGRYTTMVSIFNDVAHKLGMQPHELQAIVWIASIEKGDKKIDAKTPEEAIRLNKESIEETTDFFIRCKKVFSDLHRTITNQ